jgi:catechol 2,3-dioxygenase-like lactoylglutathione lyase family enzyme
VGRGDAASEGPPGAGRFIGCIPIADPEVARRFYVDTLGLRCLEESPYAIVVDAGRTTVRLTPVAERHPQPFTIAGFAVDELAGAVDRLAARGVPFHRYDGLDQDEHSIWDSPGGDRAAWFTDPDGRTQSLTQLAGR